MTIPFVYSILDKYLYYSQCRYNFYRMYKYNDRFNMNFLLPNSKKKHKLFPINLKMYNRYSRNFYNELYNIVHKEFISYNKSRIRKRKFNALFIN